MVALWILFWVALVLAVLSALVTIFSDEEHTTIAALILFMLLACSIAGITTAIIAEKQEQSRETR